jgi:hypothetical protein
MKTWMTHEAAMVLEWAKGEHHDRESLEVLAEKTGRTPDAIVHFLRRTLAADERPWRLKPRWTKADQEELLATGQVAGRSPEAIEKYARRRGWEHILRRDDPEEDDQPRMTVKETTRELGLSRSRVYDLLKRGLLRRFKGGVAQTSITALLREHPEEIPFHKLDRGMQEYLVVMGYQHPTIKVKMPSVRGLLK